MKIAVMPGDGVGKEVIPVGLRVLKEASRKFGFVYSTTDYPFGGEYYLETKITLPVPFHPSSSSCPSRPSS